jgi:hypothetical protein
MMHSAREITEYIKDRPREWIKVASLRCIRVETEIQFLEYVLIVQHRESWKNFATMQVSKSDIYVRALQLQRDLNMYYTAPKLPVELLGIPKGTMSRAIDEAISGYHRAPQPQEESLVAEDKNK